MILSPDTGLMKALVDQHCDLTKLQELHNCALILSTNISISLQESFILDDMRSHIRILENKYSIRFEDSFHYKITTL